MKLIVGLGNPGNKYLLTRHNIGFRVLDHIQERDALPEWELSTKFESMIVSGEIDGKKVMLVKPQTFMNGSGKVVSMIKNYYKLPLSKLLVIHDDFDLPFLTSKLRLHSEGKSSHKGIRSIVADLGMPDFTRLRVGIGSQTELEKEVFVLQKFKADELSQMNEIFSSSYILFRQWLGGNYD